MPKPNCTEEIDVGVLKFGRLGRRVVEGRFDGGSMTSDGGVMLLGQVDRKLGLMDAAARCSADKCPATQAGEGVRASAWRTWAVKSMVAATVAVLLARIRVSMSRCLVALLVGYGVKYPGEIQ